MAYLLILDGYMGTRVWDQPIPIPTLPDGHDIFPFTNLWVIFCSIPVLLLDFYPTGKWVIGNHCHPYSQSNVGILYAPNSKEPFSHTDLKMKIKLSLSMEIIILVAWVIWISRNNKNFNNQALSFHSWKAIYLQELRMMAHRMKKKHVETFREWLQTRVVFNI
jgi:hypothetical protein